MLVMLPKVGQPITEFSEYSLLDWGRKGLTDADMLAINSMASSGSMANLVSLIVDGNQIGDQGMIAFSNAISNGSMGALQDLSLGGNQIGNAGIMALVGAMGSTWGS